MTEPLRLYDIAMSYELIGEQLIEAGGELTPELEEQLNGISEAFDAKVENVALYIRNLDGTAKALDEEAQRFADRAKAQKNAAARLKDYLKRCMEQAGIDKVETMKVKARLQNSPVKLDWPGAVEELPEDYQRVSISADKAKAKDYFKANSAPPEGWVVTQDKHLRLS